MRRNLDRGNQIAGGVEIFRYIRVVHPYTPVVIMTGDPGSRLMKQALYFEPFGVLNKPFRNDDVVQIMGRFTRMSG
jgi:DNA-binding NtrC family response regulator